MNGERWEAVESIFAEVMGLNEEQRERALKRMQPLEAGVEAEVRSLLEAHDQSQGYLEDNVIAGAAHIEGMRIGPWRVAEQIGQGGMSVVYRAERVEGGYDQTVAVKVIALPALLTREYARHIVRRFEAERQIAARLDHPNICKLLDGGITSDGMPYLVLEYIEGKDLLSYSAGLAEPEKLNLLVAVSQAVHHAHQSLVVHRDLKPSNILVTAEGIPRLLDFGIAKALDPEWKVGGERTVTQLRAATPGYASPEQLNGGAITTLADVYSLGMILKRLIGQPLSGDLAAISAKATRDEPGQRYASAAGFAADIRRYLEGLPVEARQGGLRYVAGKFLRRNKTAAAAAMVAAALTVGFAVMTTIQNRRIERERERAELVAGFLRGLFQASDPAVNQGNRLTTRELLDEGARNIGNRKLDEETRLRLMETMAEAYAGLGLYEQANKLYRQMIAAWEQDSHPAAAGLARAYGGLSLGLAQLDAHGEADQASSKAVDLARQAMPPDRDTLCLMLERRCLVLQQAAKHGAAAPLCAEAARIAGSGTLPEVEHASVLRTYGRVLKYTDAFAESEKVLTGALALAGRSGPAHPITASILDEIGGLYFRQGKFADATKSFERAIEMQRTLYPGGHLAMARTKNNLANVLATTRRYSEAEVVYGEAHPLYRKFLGDDASELASSLSNLAVVQQTTGRMDEAAEVLETVMGIHERSTGRKRPYWSSALKLAILRLEQGRAAEAARLAGDSVVGFDQMQPPPAMERGLARVVLAASLIETGRARQAMEPARAGRDLLASAVGERHWMKDFADTAMGAALAAEGKQREAREMWEPLREMYGKRQDRVGWRVLWFRRLWARHFGTISAQPN